MILIFTHPNDQHARAVEGELNRRNLRFLRFHYSQYPGASEIGVVLRGREHAARLRVAGATYAFDDFRAFWYRRPGAPSVQLQDASPSMQRYIDKEARKFLASLQYLSPSSRWVPGLPRAVELAELKTGQLILASRLGFETPHTVMGNDPGLIATELLPRHERLLVKCFFSGYFQEENLSFVQKLRKRIYDFRNRKFLKAHADDPEILNLYEFRSAIVLHNDGLSRHEAEQRLDDVYSCPIIFQEYVKKALELRITVVGDRVFSCAIYSQDIHATRDDWRKYAEACRHERHALPTDIERRCIELTRELGLNFGCIDMILTPEGRYVFLEINPGGAWLWVQMLTGMPIADAIADLLTPSSRAPEEVAAHQPPSAPTRSTPIELPPAVLLSPPLGAKDEQKRS